MTEDVRPQAALEEQRHHTYEADSNSVFTAHHTNPSHGEQSTLSNKNRPVNPRQWVFGTLHKTELAESSKPRPPEELDPV